MRIAVTGATGYLAYFVVRFLCQDHALDCWVRPGRGQHGGRLQRVRHSRVTYREVDLCDPCAVRDALDGTQAIIHLAYAHVPGKYRDGHGDDLDGWFRQNLQIHLNLVLGAHAKGVRDFVFISSRAVYGTEAASLPEGEMTRPDTHYGSLKVACELLMCGFDGLRHCALRATGVYGCVEPVTQSKWYDLLLDLRSSAVLRRDRAGTEVHGHDLGRVIGKLLETQGEWPPFINVSDLVVKHSMLADMVSRRLGVPIEVMERLPAPAGVMRCDWLNDQGFRFGGEALLVRTVDQLIGAS